MRDNVLREFGLVFVLCTTRLSRHHTRHASAYIYGYQSTVESLPMPFSGKAPWRTPTQQINTSNLNTCELGGPDEHGQFLAPAQGKSLALA